MFGKRNVDDIQHQIPNPIYPFILGELIILINHSAVTTNEKVENAFQL